MEPVGFNILTILHVATVGFAKADKTRKKDIKLRISWLNFKNRRHQFEDGEFLGLGRLVGVAEFDDRLNGLELDQFAVFHEDK